jgi:hypothetical protein
MMRAATLLMVLAVGTPQDRTPAPIPADKFDRLHKTLVPTADDLAGFWDLPWEVNVHAARAKAAAQDKPILAYFGANGSVLGAT